MMPKILAVEDEELVRLLVVETLENAGYSVREAGDGEAALAILATEPDIGLIVTDIRMPRLDGYSLASAARRDRPQIALLFMTGYAGNAAPPDLAAVSMLRKPFDPDDLLAAVGRLLPAA